MSSKHYRWQDRWKLNQVEGAAVHESGLVVRLENELGVSENAAEVEGFLTPLHGAHNAPAMVKRLVREGAQLLKDPHARGWRS